VLLESIAWKVSVRSGKIFVSLFVCIVLCVSVRGIRKEKNQFEGVREGNRIERMMRPVQRKPSAHIS